MNTNELRIGNFITWMDEDNPFNSILNITGIIIGNGLFVEWSIDEKTDNTDCNFESVKPIKLTEEWLLKFGFEKKGDNWFSKGENELEWYSGIKVFVYRLKYSANRSFTVREIKYVHQLQNLYFALTSEELTQVSEGKNKNFV